MTCNLFVADSEQASVMSSAAASPSFNKKGVKLSGKKSEHPTSLNPDASFVEDEEKLDFFSEE